MHDSIRVLVVEHSDTGRFLAQRLLDDFDLEFTWQCVASEPELRVVAEEFDPNIVLCVDQTAANASHASLDMLRLLCTRKPVILISEISAANELGVSRAAELRPQTRLPAVWPPQIVESPTAAAQPAASIPKYLPAILETSSNVVVMSDARGWITYASIGACRLLRDSCDQSLVTLLGTTNDQCVRTPSWLDPAGDVPSGYSDHRLAFIDVWEPLPIQAHVNDLVGCLTARARDDNSALALVGLNLDGLQLLNEAYGCGMGDEVLSHVRSVLQSDITGCGMAARVGQDDFVVVLPHLSHAPDAAIAVQGILESVSQRRQLVEVQGRVDDGTDLQLFPANGFESQGVLRPVSGIVQSESVPWHDEQLQPVSEYRCASLSQQAQMDLEDAIQRHALSLQYQPQYELQSGRGCGVEVLARWTRSNGESMAPAVFIPLAERGGTIRMLGAWVLDCACQTAAGWRGRDAEALTVSVNVSTMQIDERFYGVLLAILKSSGFPAWRLELEISESAIIANTNQTLHCLQQWKELGVRIAVNHFGIDYSSLSYLARLRVDRLKLDKSLVHNMTLNKKGECVMNALIALGAELGVDVIAEGVETEPQFQMLADLGCPQAQGYLLARPMLATQAQVALRKSWGNLPQTAHRNRAVGPQMQAS
ncbi:MAG: GGDEF domain-containing phosphodiesterase [Gammaproteobacteria bacterium]